MNAAFFLLIAIISVVVYKHCRPIIEENFYVYTRQPYDEVDTGSDPLGFYRRDRYRKPYMWPRKFFTTYPFPHMDNVEDVQ